MVPVACVNALLKYTTRELALGLRQKLTEHLQAKYLRGFTFYSVATLEGCARYVSPLLSLSPLLNPSFTQPLKSPSNSSEPSLTYTMRTQPKPTEKWSNS